MTINWYSIMGYIATVLAIISYVPQLIKTIKEKKGGTLSQVTFTMLTFGCVFWAVYTGLLKHDTHMDAGVLVHATYLDVLPAFITNVVIFFLMIPLLWYVTNDAKKFIVLLVVGLMIIALAFIFMFSNIIDNIPQAVKYIFVIIAGSLTGFPFIPQTWRIIRDKHIGDVSLNMILFVIITNIFWVLYWAGMIPEHTTDGTVYLSTFFTFMALATNIPTVYIYFFNKKKAKTLKVNK